MAKDGASAGEDARRLERLKREAEIEMRRRLEDSRPSKRSKLPAPLGRAGAGGVPFVPVDRFRYAVVGELEAGAKGFVVTCNFRKEKSATREASQLLRRYMPAHLFPPPPQPELVPASQAVPQGPQGMVEAQPAAGAAAGAGKEVGAEAQQEVPGGRKAAAAAAKEDEEVEGDAESGGSSDDDSEEGQDPAGVGAAAAGAGAADHHPEPSALGLAKVGCRGVVVMRLSSQAAAEVEPVRLLEALLADLEAARAAQAAAKQQKLQKKGQRQKQQGRGQKQEGGGQEPEEKVQEPEEEKEEHGQEERGAAAPPLQQPKHCQRLVPLDATCALTPAGLTRAVMDAAAAYRLRLAAPASGPGADGPQVAAAAEEPRPFTYAVLYHSRDTTETAAAAPAPGASGPAAGAGSTDAAIGAGSKGGEGEGELTDRGRIIEIVAAAMRSAFRETASVNLKKPDVAVVVEAMPVAGRRFAGVSLLGSHLILAKGKLQVKPLTNNPPPQPKPAGHGKGKGKGKDPKAKGDEE